MDRRVTIINNRRTDEKKVILIKSSITGLDSFLDACANKLRLNAMKVFLEDGGEIDDMDMIRDGDKVYVSCGEAFYKTPNSNRMKEHAVAVMGPGSVGKSAITLQFVRGVFINDYDPTIEDAYRKNTSVDGERCVIDILDTAGQEDFIALRSTWMRQRDGFLLVFSVDDRSTFDVLHKFYDQLCVVHEDNIPPIVILGNKCDLKQREVAPEEGKQLARDWENATYMETSAKTGYHIDDCFNALVRKMRDMQPNQEADTTERKVKKKSFFARLCTIL